MGAWSKPALALVTSWGASNAAAVWAGAAAAADVAGGVSRITCFDPSDAVIHWRASLAYALAERALLTPPPPAPPLPAGLASEDQPPPVVAVSSGDDAERGASDGASELWSVAVQLYFTASKLAVLCAPAFLHLQVGERVPPLPFLPLPPPFPPARRRSFPSQRNAEGGEEASFKPLAGRPLPDAAVAALGSRWTAASAARDAAAAGSSGSALSEPPLAGGDASKGQQGRATSRSARLRRAEPILVSPSADSDVESGADPQAPSPPASVAPNEAPLDPRDVRATRALLAARYGGASLPAGSFAERAAGEWALGRLPEQLRELGIASALSAAQSCGLLERTALHDLAAHWTATAQALGSSSGSGGGPLAHRGPRAIGAGPVLRSALASAGSDAPARAVGDMTPVSAGLVDPGAAAADAAQLAGLALGSADLDEDARAWAALQQRQQPQQQQRTAGSAPPTSQLQRGGGGAASSQPQPLPSPRQAFDWDSAVFADAATAYGTPVAVLVALAGLPNGLGQRLGDALGHGPEGVLQFLCGGLAWGWQAQEGRRGGGGSPLYALLCAAQDALQPAAAAASSPTASPASPQLASSSSSSDGSDAGALEWAPPSDWAHAWPLPQAGVLAGKAAASDRAEFGRQAPHLQHSGRSGPAHLIRRLAAVAVTAATAAPASSSPAGAGHDVPASSTAAAASATDVGARPLPGGLMPEICALARRIYALQRRSRAPPASLRDAMAAAPEGLCVPLTCGHNAAWSRLEVGMVARAVTAAVGGSGGVRSM